jgi:hypothetical protein
LASDATQLTAANGDLQAHPLMMSLDNIRSTVRRKSSNHAYMLLALLPKIEFLVTDARYVSNASKIASTLKHRAFHICLRIATEPLRKISHLGKMMSDPLGQKRWCFTVSSAYLADHPEARMVAGVISGTSPTTLAFNNQFGDDFLHERRWLQQSKALYDELAVNFHPWGDIEGFSAAAHKKRLTGVVDSIWVDWAHSEPSFSLAFDVLHSGHKFFKDHPLLWSEHALSTAELDFRFQVLHPRKGWRHFPQGITTLQKTGGRENRDIQRYLLCVLDGAPVGAGFTRLVRAYLDYFYIAQGLQVSMGDLQEILDLITEFHARKDIVHRLNYREVPGFNIPKLEHQHNIVPSIMTWGNLLGLSTDAPEHEHIELIRDPFRRTNHKDFQPQMLTYLDRLERMRHFDLATTLVTSGDREKIDPAAFPEELDEEEHAQWLDNLKTVQNLRGSKRPDYMNYFTVAKNLVNLSDDQRRRVRTFVPNSFTAIHLNRDPSIKIISIQEAAMKFRIPDLGEAIQEYLYRQTHSLPVASGLAIARSAIPQPAPPLPFDKVRVWFSIRVQTKSLLSPGRVNKAAAIAACPPSNDTWSHGRCDCALFINDVQKPFSGHANLMGL